MSAISQDIREAGFVSKIQSCAESDACCDQMVETKSAWSLFTGPVWLVQWTDWINKGVAVPSSSEDEHERFVGGAGVGLSCMQCSHGYIQSRPPNTHKSCTLMNSNIFCSENSTKKSIFEFPLFHQTENIFNLILVGFYEFFTTMQWPRYYISQIAYKKHSFKPIRHTFTQRQFPHSFWKQC